jgi:regulator of protease activity HflC (stomatin/prohibitin superfamily)
MLFKFVRVRSYEIGLYFRHGEFQGLLGTGRHLLFNPFGAVRVDVISQHTPFILHDQLDVMVRSGKLDERIAVVDLRDHERGLVWIDGRFQRILPPGQYAYCTQGKDVRVEVVDAREVRFRHESERVILRSPQASQLLDICRVQRNHVGVVFLDGEYVETLPPGEVAYWRSLADARVVEVDMREQTIDVGGQEIMTSDKVTLRMNAVVTYRVVDAQRAVTVTDGATQALYRESQLALRAVVGTRELDALLSDKDGLVQAFAEGVRRRASELGLEVISAGIRDVILPGEMKDLMNKVTEARKAAEANLIVRREETAAMRSQVNTARLLADNPTLMRLRELEILEKVVTNGNLQVVLGEQGLGDRIMKLL